MTKTSPTLAFEEPLKLIAFGGVIFSTCSILDINDYNNNYRWEPVEHNLSPGKSWEAVGPSVLLGYNYAPADKTGAPT